jgi:hypothetical protein
MDFMRKHWFDVGLGLSVLAATWLAVSWSRSLPLQRILLVSLITLFLHQFEEYRLPGGFARMMNTAMFSSDTPDRYPLNANTALIINMTVGWLSYLLAVLFARQAIWLGIATILVSAGNFFAHAALFNIKGRTRYNPGMVTSIFLFLPVAVIFFSALIRSGAAGLLDWIGGIALGVVLNAVGILKLIDWLKDRDTKYEFKEE